VFSVPQAKISGVADKPLPPQPASEEEDAEEPVPEEESAAEADAEAASAVVAAPGAARGLDRDPARRARAADVPADPGRGHGHRTAAIWRSCT